jgi:hypothetical protein
MMHKERKKWAKGWRRADLCWNLLVNFLLGFSFSTDDKDIYYNAPKHQ